MEILGAGHLAGNAEINTNASAALGIIPFTPGTPPGGPDPEPEPKHPPKFSPALTRCRHEVWTADKHEGGR